jgi:hypothetical protein
MNKLKISFAILLFTTALFTACHNHKDEGDTTAPVLTITSPSADASLSGIVEIKGTATDAGLHEMSIIITKDSDKSELFKNNPVVHDKTDFTIAESWTPTGITQETAVTLTIITEDHSALKTTKTVSFKVKP